MDSDLKNLERGIKAVNDRLRGRCAKATMIKQLLREAEKKVKFARAIYVDT